MTDNHKFLHWLTLEEGKTVKFSDLAHLMAQAMNPRDGSLSYGADRINLEEELKQAVKDGALVVRNPAGLGRHTFPIGAALQSAVLIPSIDLRSFLEARGMGLRLTANGNGPGFWTLKNAASALQIQEGWHDGTTASFLHKLCEAACRGEMVTRDPHTDLIERGGVVMDAWNTVTPADVNAWLDTQGVAYRWNVAPLIEVPHKSPRDFKPWETLVPFFEPLNGLFMYQQAAREIADAEDWNDERLVALEAEMLRAINDHALPVRDRSTGMEAKHDAWDALKLVTVDDVNEWLERKRVPYRWKLQRSVSQPQAALGVAERARGGVAPPKQRTQENRIVELLTAQGYNPLTLPSRVPGKPGPKAEIKKLALLEPALFTAKTFDTAWQRARDDGRISGGE